MSVNGSAHEILVIVACGSSKKTVHLHSLTRAFAAWIDKIGRASDFFQDWWAEATHGAKNSGSFSEMMSPSISN